jgi:general stress protein 26
MSKLSDEIIDFFQKQGFTVVSTLDTKGSIHNSCKGIVKIDKSGKIYLLDLYSARTLDNLKKNPHISLTAVDEHSFSGYCLKGKGKIIKAEQLDSSISKAWEEKITGRISRRIIRNLHGEQGHPRHPEANLPKPQYMILMEVAEVVDLTPGHIK